MTIALPRPDGTTERYQMLPVREWPMTWEQPRSRVAYAAAHVVADPLGEPASPSPALDWAATHELARRTADAARDFGDPADLVVVGAGTDHARDVASLDQVASAYVQQLTAIRATGAGVVLMGSRELARLARGPEDYLQVYGQVLAQADRPVILHWLGEMFDPQLAGYWGSRGIWEASETVLSLVRDNAARVDGIKVSLLDAGHEAALRAALPPGVKLYTGDDFNYASLIASGSHAILGIFDAIAPIAATALRALDDGDKLRYEELLGPTVPLARKIFEAPTQDYKTGLVFLAWLAGYQDAFVMVRGAQSARSLPHLAEVFRLADYAGLLPHPGLAMRRMSALLALHGCAQ